MNSPEANSFPYRILAFSAIASDLEIASGSRYWGMNGTSESIVLIGMMGAGKSSIGCCLQRRTGVTVVDVDEIVMSKFGTSIQEIFSKYGEDEFREAETEALRGLTPHQQTIIVTGGGIVLREENVGLLRRLGAVIWLEADAETLFKRASRTANRPLLQTRNPRKAFVRMLQTRVPIYAKIADIRIDTSVFTEEEVAVAVLSKLGRFYRNRIRESWIPATVQ
jgi:shikimate kinase